MAERERIGRWTGFFGQPMSFEEEIKRAKTVRAELLTDDGELFIKVLDRLPGWEVPLWGSDARWLYLRRPEGVWKIELAKQVLIRDMAQPRMRPSECGFVVQAA